MDKWPVLGALMLVAGLAILLLLASIIVGIIVFILEVIAIFIGVILVLGGVAMLTFGRRWRGRRPNWGPPPAEA